MVPRDTWSLGCAGCSSSLFPASLLPLGPCSTTPLPQTIFHPTAEVSVRWVHLVWGWLLPMAHARWPLHHLPPVWSSQRHSLYFICFSPNIHLAFKCHLNSAALEHLHLNPQSKLLPFSTCLSQSPTFSLPEHRPQLKTINLFVFGCFACDALTRLCPVSTA